MAAGVRVSADTSAAFFEYLKSNMKVKELSGKNRPIIHSVVALGVLAACLVSISGCASPVEVGDSDLPDIPIENFEDVKASLNFESGTVQLPMDRYSLQTPEVTSKVLTAMKSVRDRCLQNRGLQVPDGDRTGSLAPQPENRRYGVWSVTNASLYGFSFPPEVSEGAWAPDTTALGIEYNRAFSECSSEAQQSLKEELEFLSAPNLDWRIRDKAESLALGTDVGVAAMESWRACTEAQGVVLDSESGFPSELYARQSKESEIRVAVAYAECGVSTGAVQTMFDTQAKFEAAYVTSQEAALQEFVAQRDAVFAQLDEAIAGR